MSVPLREWLGSVPWLTGLPARWRVQRFKSVAILSTHDNASHDDRLLSLSTTRGIVPKQYDDENRVRSGEDLQRYWRVRPGHLVVNPMWLAHGSIASSAIEGVISPDYRVYETNASCDARYLAALLRTHEYRGLYDLFVRGSTTYDRRVSKDDFHSIPVLVPPLESQRAIANFLDRKTAAIDALIAKKERLIELLQEKRQALITQAVTKGLDPDVPMKESGIEWLGRIPAHWKAMPLKHAVLDVIDCKNRTPDYFEDGKYGVVRTTNVKSGAFVTEELLWTNEREFRVWTQRGVPQPGDVLFTREAPAGEACIVPASPSICLGQRMMLFRVGRHLVDSDFVLFSVYGPQVQEFIAANTQGSTVHHLRVDQVRNLPFLVPPPEEQTRIGTFLRDSCGRMDRVFASIRAHIARLREYRQALITAAVTGKLDVSKEAA